MKNNVMTAKELLELICNHDWETEYEFKIYDTAKKKIADKFSVGNNKPKTREVTFTIGSAKRISSKGDVTITYQECFTYNNDGMESYAGFHDGFDTLSVTGAVIVDDETGDELDSESIMSIFHQLDRLGSKPLNPQRIDYYDLDPVSKIAVGAKSAQDYSYYVSAQATKESDALFARNEKHIKESVISHLFASWPKDIEAEYLFDLLIVSNEENPINDHLFSKLTLEEGFGANSKESLGWLVSGEYCRLHDLIRLCNKPLPEQSCDKKTL